MKQCTVHNIMVNEFALLLTMANYRYSQWSNNQDITIIRILQ